MILFLPGIFLLWSSHRCFIPSPRLTSGYRVALLTLVSINPFLPADHLPSSPVLSWRPCCCHTKQCEYSSQGFSQGLDQPIPRVHVQQLAENNSQVFSTDKPPFVCLNALKFNKDSAQLLHPTAFWSPVRFLFWWLLKKKALRRLRAAIKQLQNR